MTKESPSTERLLAELANAGRSAPDNRHAEDGESTLYAPPDTRTPLTGFLERVIIPGDSGSPASELSAEAEAILQDNSPAPEPAPVLPIKLIEELRAAQALRRPQPPAELLGMQTIAAGPAVAQMATEEQGHRGAQFEALLGKAQALIVRKARTASDAARRLSRRMTLRDWQRRYFTLLCLIHRYLLDRRVEQLLFIKSPPLKPGDLVRSEPDNCKSFRYCGPIPGKVLDWALSSLPSNLKRFAFADFRAGNGRTLLLAARRNFEHATGYVFDNESCEILEMNLAQYSRSYMSCRDVRALRADKDGIIIPAQPLVLFFPASLAESHLKVILSQIEASLRHNPRQLYLIFENAGAGKSIEYTDIFERMPLPLLNRIKVYLFSPIKIGVYQSLARKVAD